MLTEHDMDVIFGLADRIMVMNYGEVIAIGTPQCRQMNAVESRSTVCVSTAGAGTRSNARALARLALRAELQTSGLLCG